MCPEKCTTPSPRNPGCSSFVCPVFPAEPPWHGGIIEFGPSLAFLPPKFISIWDLKMRHAMSGPFPLLMRQNGAAFFQLCHSRRQQLNTNGRAHINQRSRSRELLLLNIQSRSAKAVVNTSSADEMEGYTCARQVLRVYYPPHITSPAASRVSCLLFSRSGLSDVTSANFLDLC